MRQNPPSSRVSLQAERVLRNFDPYERVKGSTSTRGVMFPRTRLAENSFRFQPVVSVPLVQIGRQHNWPPSRIPLYLVRGPRVHRSQDTRRASTIPCPPPANLSLLLPRSQI